MSFVTFVRSALVLSLVLLTWPAQAQQRTKVTVSAGYQDMVYTIAQNEDPLPPGFVWVCPDRVRGCQFTSGSYSLHGFYFDAAAHVGGNVAVVGEWNWNRSTDPGLFGGDPEVTIPGLKVSVQQFSAGLRFLVPRERFVPFVQVLAGAARVAASAASISDSVTAADVHVGGGIDVMFSDSVGIRGSGSYTRLFTSEVRRNNLAQFGVGVVLRR